MIENFSIPVELKKLPATPGVYLMHDREDRIIYVGKAKVLKNRVRQYFQNPDRLSLKIQRMVENIAWFEYIVVDTELEALVLECNLIKEHRPKYNTMLKDDKTYPYIKVTMGEAFPRVLLDREQKKDKARYFGPYTNGVSVNETIELLRKVYQVRTCNKNLPEAKPGRPCLYHQIGQCKAPCMGYVSQQEYAATIERVLQFLEGDYREILAWLKERMERASMELAFEEAAGYRDLMKQVQALAQKQKAADTRGEERDIIALAVKKSHCVIQVFFEREGRLLGREHYHMDHCEGRSEEELLSEFIKQYYAGTPYLPKELLVELPVLEEELIAQWLTARKGQKVTIRVPKIGEKEKLISLAKQNAEMVLNRDLDKITREEKRSTGAVQELEGLLGLTGIVRMESFDISNTSGFYNVGSMVVYEGGKPKKSDYRKFRMKTVEGPNDYASMEEVLTRRFRHGINDREQGLDNSFTRYPDLILMDGGKGQISIAEQVCSRLGLSIPICGMVKDDHHRTRGLYFQGREIPISAGQEAFRLITRIQDETHRFAIEYHKSLRLKGQVHSILDDIPGIGEQRRKSLMKAFSGLQEIRQASVEEMAVLPQMNTRAAQAVYDFFHTKENPTGDEAQE